MIIGDRLRELREQKKLSQREIEKRSGLLRAYLSRVENGHTVPAIETLEKWAKALQVPMYQLFYEGAEPPDPSTLRKLDEDKRRLILQMASRMARRSQKSAAE